MVPESVIVTGGAGFIGSALIRDLIADSDFDVINIDKLTYAGNPDALASVRTSPRYVFEQIDICDSTELRRILRTRRPVGVFHLAAESHVDRSIDDAGEFVRTNIVGTYTLLREVYDFWRELSHDERSRFRFLHVSTDEVFGSLPGFGRFSEVTPYAPNSPYSASKASSDHLVRAWHHTYGLPTLVTNCSNNYGPYQFPEKLIPLMILNGLGGKPLPVYGRGRNIRDWLFVDDHVAALRLVFDNGRPGETYTVGGDSERTNLEVVELTCDLLDELSPDPNIGARRSLITFVADRPGHDLRYAIDAGKIQRELGWRPRQDFEGGLRRTVEWYLAHQDWCSRIRSGAYRGERLGLSTARP